MYIVNCWLWSNQNRIPCLIFVCFLSLHISFLLSPSFTTERMKEEEREVQSRDENRFQCILKKSIFFFCLFQSLRYVIIQPAVAPPIELQLFVSLFESWSSSPGLFIIDRVGRACSGAIGPVGFKKEEKTQAISTNYRNADAHFVVFLITFFFLFFCSEHRQSPCLRNSVCFFFGVVELTSHNEANYANKTSDCCVEMEWRFGQGQVEWIGFG